MRRSWARTWWVLATLVGILAGPRALARDLSPEALQALYVEASDDVRDVIRDDLGATPKPERPALVVVDAETFAGIRRLSDSRLETVVAVYQPAEDRVVMVDSYAQRLTASGLPTPQIRSALRLLFAHELGHAHHAHLAREAGVRPEGRWLREGLAEWVSERVAQRRGLATAAAWTRLSKRGVVGDLSPGEAPYVHGHYWFASLTAEERLATLTAPPSDDAAREAVQPVLAHDEAMEAQLDALADPLGGGGWEGDGSRSLWWYVQDLPPDAVATLASVRQLWSRASAGVADAPQTRWARLTGRAPSGPVPRRLTVVRFDRPGLAARLVRARAAAEPSSYWFQALGRLKLSRPSTPRYRMGEAPDLPAEAVAVLEARDGRRALARAVWVARGDVLVIHELHAGAPITPETVSAWATLLEAAPFDDPAPPWVAAEAPPDEPTTYGDRDVPLLVLRSLGVSGGRPGDRFEEARWGLVALSRRLDLDVNAMERTEHYAAGRHPEGGSIEVGWLTFPDAEHARTLVVELERGLRGPWKPAGDVGRIHHLKRQEQDGVDIALRWLSPAAYGAVLHRIVLVEGDRVLWVQTAACPVDRARIEAVMREHLGPVGP